MDSESKKKSKETSMVMRPKTEVVRVCVCVCVRYLGYLLKIDSVRLTDGMNVVYRTRRDIWRLKREESKMTSFWFE